MFDLIPSFITAFIITFFAIPSIIKIAIEKNLCDEPGERRSHNRSIPTLGGLGVFAGLIFSITFWIPFDSAAYPAHRYVQYVLCAYIIIFLIGAKDDIIPLSPIKKFLGQIVAACILVFKAGIYLSSLYGIFGINDIPYALAAPLSVFSMLVIINALNLIDGINGLAATIGIICCGVLGLWFYQFGRLDLAILAFAMLGALAAFLYYNASPAKIFMGDTGSLLLGLTLSVLAISFIESNKLPHEHCYIESVPAVAIAILIIPLFDTLRVFSLRAMRGKSPFQPDRTHIHHILIDLGCSHMQATAILALINLLFIGIAFQLQFLGSLELLLVLLLIAVLLTSFSFYLINRKQGQKA
ncbi:MraY family glycosyltransferase [Saprospira sp. CCB-QB6]|uniref:glycosyltransferase family 4 protein n=1 Tax=Saprospira sp. CCB-QB6 TaxID=3023936 RepID=UPI00234AB4A3|nr:MraY family glycosyltransferase [Saprospira sp. CCB-QB6]WCL80176.1 MraY family glycosyltransferase [Saprospira sp. CCB-QB6]